MADSKRPTRTEGAFGECTRGRFYRIWLAYLLQFRLADVRFPSFFISFRDYRTNHDRCQILITVPQILEILLLSPARSGSWASRIKRIIFDEIHCIGEADGGSVWEHLLLLAQC